MLRLLLWTLLATQCVLCVRAESVTVRVAMISNAGTADLAALVTAELSGDKEITLLERDDLAKVGDELKLQQLASSDPIALGKIVGADGLLFLDQNGNNFHVRFTAVGLGYALFDDQISSGEDVAQLAKSIAHRVTGYAVKLKLSPTQAIPLSVLNLRADYGTPQSETLERSLTLLLESRLAAQPDYVVLERRHAGPLGFEHTLAPHPELLRGVWVIDGSLQFSTGDRGPIVASLRLRPPGSGKESTLEIKGSSDDLPGFVNAMAAGIERDLGASPTATAWDSKAEAREYLHEGIWAWQHDDPRAALEALDAASLLGETANDLWGVRALVLSGLSQSQPYSVSNPVPLSLQERSEMMSRALQDLKVYGDSKGETRLLFIDPAQNLSLVYWRMRETLAYQGLALLAELRLANEQESAGELKTHLRQLMDFDPEHGKAPLFRDIDILSNSLQEELAYYRLRAVKGSVWSGTFDPVGFCGDFLKTPAEQKSAFDKFLQDSLLKPDTRLFGLQTLSQSDDLATREKYYPQFIAELWNQREELVRPGHTVRNAWYGSAFRGDLQEKYYKNSVPLLRYCLTHYQGMDGRIFDYLWKPQWFPPDQVDGIWSDAQGLIREMVSQYGMDFFRTNNIYLQFVALYPSKAIKPEESAKPLIVDRYWEPAPAGFVLTGIEPSATGVSVMAQSSGSDIYQVNSSNMSADCIATPASAASFFRSNAETFYMVYDDLSQHKRETYLARYDRVSRSWTSRRIPGNGGLFFVGKQIYLATAGLDESGLARYDWDEDKIVVLASNRRRPAQNQFDDCPAYSVFVVFPAPDGQICVQFSQGIFYLQEGPGTWKKVTENYKHELLTMRSNSGHSEGHSYQLVSPNGVQKTFALLWSSPDQKQAIRIPLRFTIHGSEAEVSSKIWPQIPTRWGLWVTPTAHGICFFSLRGLWFLSFDEIESYLNANPQVALASLDIKPATIRQRKAPVTPTSPGNRVMEAPPPEEIRVDPLDEEHF
jgi:hypothetical protein